MAGNPAIVILHRANPIVHYPHNNQFCPIPTRMNPNPPNHIPSNFARPVAASKRIAKWGGARIFSRPAKDAFDAARRLHKRSRRISRIKGAEPVLGAQVPETGAGSELNMSAREATIHIDWTQGLSGAAIDGHLRLVCNYANEWHQRMDPARNYTGVGVSHFNKLLTCTARSPGHAPK